MKTITVEVDDDEVLVAIKRPPEDYEDVHPEILADDAMMRSPFEYRVVSPKEAP